MEVDVGITIVTPSCRLKDENDSWSNENEQGNCVVGERSNLEFTECKCLQTGSELNLGVEMFSPPQTIDFGSVFVDFDFGDNPGVIITVVVFLVIFLLGLVYTLKQDKIDRATWKIGHVLTERGVGYKWYLMSIQTGFQPKAGTKSKVCFKFNLDDDGGIIVPSRSLDFVFSRGGTIDFLLKEIDMIHVKSLSIWHDNSDNSGWKIEKITLTRVAKCKNKSYIFPVDDWLAVSYGLFRTNVTVNKLEVDKNGEISQSGQNVTENQTKKPNSYFYLTQFWKNFFLDHIWFRTFFLSQKSTFNRTQSWMVCFLLLYLTFVTNCMWFETGQPGENIIDFGPIQMSGAQIWASVCSSLVSVPVVTLMVFLFKNTSVDKTAKKAFTIPRFFVYIWYILSFAGIVSSAFFTILYSMQFGKEKSNRWLTNALVTFFQDVIILQPVKVAILTFLLTVLARKLDWKEKLRDREDTEIQSGFAKMSQHIY